MKKIWIIKKKASNEFFDSLFEFPKPIVQLFFNRGLDDRDSISKFLNPSMNDLHDPLKILNLEESAKKIVSAIKDNKRIAIYGDYDTDGICSSVVLSTAFKRFGFNNFDVFIPNRYKDGYGLTNIRVKQMAEMGVNLIITVDCGITDIEEIELAKKLGVEVLVFDHHPPKKELPKTLIVDPFQENDSYPFKPLSATGVVYKLIKVLSDMLEFRFWKSLERQILDLVALATVADLVPMLGENRVLVKYGLKQLKETSNIGLKALLKNSNIDNLVSYNTWHLGFILSPRLNATGRVLHKMPEGKLESVDYSFALLNSENEKEVEMWTKRVNVLNEGRIKQTKQIFDYIKKIIEEKDEFDKIIFLGNSEWPKGLLGLIASKIVDNWNRPAFVYNKGKKTSVGSVRSIPSVDINELLDRAGDILIEFGGHKMAGVFYIKNENIEKFKDFLKKEEEKLKEEDLIPRIEIEAVLEPKHISSSFWQIFQNFEPFGKDNPEPIFLMKDVVIRDIRAVGNGEKHLKMSIEKNGKVFNGIAFNGASKLEFLQKSVKANVIFHIKHNVWQGREYLDLQILDADIIK